MTDVSDYAGRFLNAAEEIRLSLAKRYPQERFKGLGDAYRHAAKNKNPIICQHEKTLEKLTELRNVMQHSPVLNGAVLATPREDAVLALEVIAHQVNPPKDLHLYD